MSSRKVWSVEEDAVILGLVSKHGNGKWREISADFSRSTSLLRSGKQCRERYINHLNPQVRKKGWSKAEQEVMLAQHLIHGNKWTLIAEHLPGRTDNSIKNYFYSTVRRSLRRMSKLLGQKDSTSRMKYIKPSTLSRIFSHEESSAQDLSPERKELSDYLRANCEDLSKEIILFSNVKASRKKRITPEIEGRLKNVLEKMERVNQIYVKIKQEETQARTRKIQQRKEIKHLLGNFSSEEEQEQEQENEDSHSENCLCSQQDPNQEHQTPASKGRDAQPEMRDAQPEMRNAQPEMRDAQPEMRELPIHKNGGVLVENEIVSTGVADGTEIEEEKASREDFELEPQEFNIEIKEITPHANGMYFEGPQVPGGYFFNISPSNLSFFFVNSASPCLPPECITAYLTNITGIDLEEEFNTLKQQIQFNSGVNSSAPRQENINPIISPKSAFHYYK